MRAILLLATMLLFGVRFTYAEEPEESFVAVKLDEGLCQGSRGTFLPIPTLAGHADPLSIINSGINREFGRGCKLNGLLVQGWITEETLQQFKLAHQTLESRRNTNDGARSNTLWLNSRGGLVFSSMELGDLVAEREMEAIVAFRGSCLSSCVLVYAAAKIRSGIGKVGVHRPFSHELSTESLSYSQYLAQYEVVTPILKKYLAKYGVSPTLVDAMNVVPSDEIKILSLEEMKSFGLGFENVAAKEFEKAKTIQVCGPQYHDLELKFHSTLSSCYEKVKPEDINKCWDSTAIAFPQFRKEFDRCKALKQGSKQSGS